MNYLHAYRQELLDKIETLHGKQCKQILEDIPIKVVSRSRYLGQISFNVPLWERCGLLRPTEIRINYGLVLADKELGRHTLAHEFAHGIQGIKYPNTLLRGEGIRSAPHGKEFKQIMQSLGYPNARAAAKLPTDTKNSIQLYNRLEEVNRYV